MTRLWTLVVSVAALMCAAAYAGYWFASQSAVVAEVSSAKEVIDTKPGVETEYIAIRTSQPTPQEPDSLPEEVSSPEEVSATPQVVTVPPKKVEKCWRDDEHAQAGGECAAINCGHHYFGSEYPLTAEMFERSVPYTPNEDPLKDVILRAAQGGNITVYVVGGSMTIGGECIQPGVSSYLQCSWQTRVKNWLKIRFPKAQIQVVNKSIGACSTVCHIHNIPFNIPHDTKGVDLVIVDTGVNDGTQTGPTNKEVEGSGELRYWTEVMLRYLLSLPSRPAVLYVEGIHTRNSPMTFDVAEEHKKTTKAYGIPMVSYRDAIWPKVNLSAPGKVLLSTLWDHDLHPSWKTHQLFADTLTHYIESIYLSLCAEDFKNVPGKFSTSTLAPGGETKNSHIGAVSSGDYISFEGPFLYKETEHIWNKFKLPNAPHSYMFASIGGGVNVTAPAHAFSASRIWPTKDAWSFKIDKTGKGWSPTKFSPGASITFSVDCGSGNGTAFLFIAYLRNYNGMGRANVKINGEVKRVMDGLWRERSFPIYQYVDFEVPQNPQTEITFTMLPKLQDKNAQFRGGHTFRLDKILCAA